VSGFIYGALLGKYHKAPKGEWTT